VHETTLSLSYRDPATARIVERSLQQEAGSIAGDRTEARVELSGTEVTVTIRAEDLVGLRAGQNTWLGLTIVAERTIDAGRGAPGDH